MKASLRPLGLYVHIPFCKRKCVYCDFYSLPEGQADMDRYAGALRTHLTETAAFSAGYLVDTVYFGGGTPSLFGEKRLTELWKIIRKHYRLDRHPEVTMEANPDSAGDWKALRALRRAGFNRVSLGMQSARDDELALLGRVHTAAQTAAAVEAVRKAGFQNLSLDLIYGLPDQCTDSWVESLRAAIDYGPEHISCYGLKAEEGTPLYDRRDTLPGDDTQADMYMTAVEVLSQAGYEQYEISNFAKPGFASRHNLKYWSLQEYQGFGPGAHSDAGGVRSAYERDLEAYIRGVETGNMPYSENDRIPPQDRDMEWLMLRCRTVLGLDPKEYENRFRRRFDVFVPFLTECAEHGYAKQAEGRWHLTPEGFLVSNQIIGELLDILSDEKRRKAEAEARGDYRVFPAGAR